MREVEVSSPGKAILYGEHAVVFGKTALAVSVNIRTRLTVKEGEDMLVVKFSDLNKVYSWRLEELLELKKSLCLETCRLNPTPADADTVAGVDGFVTSSCNNNNPGSDNGIVAFLYLYLRMFSTLPPLSVTLQSDIPIGAGLGSSAAMSVCFSSGLFLYLNQGSSVLNGTNGHINGTNGVNGVNGVDYRVDREEIDMSCEHKQLVSDWAFMSEKIMHGTPSGIDNSVSTFGGILAYRSGEMSQVSELCSLQILLVNTKVPRNTRELVSAVRTKHSLLPKVIGPIFDAIERISQTAIAALQSVAGTRIHGQEDLHAHYSTLENLIDINQGLLHGLGVSHPALGQVVEISAANNIHAKLTGAGGGGFALALITPKTHRHQVEKTRRELEAVGFACYETQIGGEGVRAAYI